MLGSHGHLNPTTSRHAPPLRATAQDEEAVSGPITAPMMSEMLAANQPVVVDDTHIISVWRDNLEQAFNDIAQIVQTVRPPRPFPPAFRPRA